MIYQILRFPLVVLFFVFYRRIYFTGQANIPQNAPTLIASNHSTAFIEQMLIATLQWRSVYFWARGSVFNEKWSMPKLFRQAHLIPIWRPQEGLKKMYQNKQVFEDSKQILLDGNMLYIAPEGNCKLEKRLRPFKTGTARIALQTAAANNFEKDVFIVPTGVNYTYHKAFRSEVVINCGKPINVLNYGDLYQKNPTAAAQQLTDDLKLAIAKEAVVIDAVEDEELVEQLHLLLRNEHRHFEDKGYSKNPQRLKTEQMAATVCNRLSATEKAAFKQQVDAYFEQLKTQQLEDEAVALDGNIALGKYLKTIVFTPLAILGWIGGYIPVQGARYLRNNNVQDMQFWAPMAIVFSLVTWMFYSILLVGIGQMSMGWLAFLLPLVFIALQALAFENKESWEQIWARQRYLKFKKNNPDLAQEMKKERAILVELFFSYLN